MKLSWEQENSNWSFLLRRAGDNQENWTTKMTARKDRTYELAEGGARSIANSGVESHQKPH